ncbi:heavy metal-responsive transcriptional regulator [Thermosynechococcaceae cyanobacterium BACA0444]|uniref:Heavy metal-responsive transcriptional regulator n=1 Tax=Pseudocalidococcus azoricus BACA0444 TaxID=2918990 RepID=A0AAE4JWS7_9CYAN|nr:heavy metal-responsive transcriptional regulator [Pseudocalidococcus azoricus]MDS3861720.1 heavy metal-responsive transcriptional regulator [Pseudocalidococcus azoricus BACA0444]
MATRSALKIGDVAKQSGVSVPTLRYYETLGLITPAERGDNGYRYYALTVISQVLFIKKAQALGLALDEIRQILDVRDRGELPCEMVQSLLAQKIQQLNTQISQMQTFKQELEAYQTQWQGITPQLSETEICPLIETVTP